MHNNGNTVTISSKLLNKLYFIKYTLVKFLWSMKDTGPFDSILTFCEFSITYVCLNLLGPHLLLCWKRLAETLPEHNILKLTDAGKTENSYEPSSDCAHSLPFLEVTNITKYTKLSINPYGKTPQGQKTTANFTASISTWAANSKWPNCIPVSNFLNHSDSNKNKITETWLLQNKHTKKNPHP